MNIMMVYLQLPKNNWQNWVEYFLQAIVEQSNTNISNAKEILSLYEKQKTKFINITHSRYAVPALDAFFNSPIINSVYFVKLSGIPNKITGNDLLRKLVKSGSISILRKGRGRMPTVYALPDLLNIAEGKKVL
jgi:hypothetical protein